MPQTLTFNPNIQGQGAPEWFVYHAAVGNRKRLHVYATRGGALAAFGHYSPGAILYRYDFAEGQWIEVWRVEKRADGDPPLTCDHCFRDPKQIQEDYERETGQQWYRYNSAFSWQWVDKKTDTPRYVPLCSDCRKLVPR